MKKPVFVLIHENGESYDDYSEWVAGVFSSKAAALKASQAGKGPECHGIFRTLEKWQGLKLLASFNAQGEKS